MIKVGLTGGIGSGKSLVAKVFNKIGAPVYDSDSIAKQLYLTDKLLKQKMVEAFGEECYLSDGQLNKAYIRQLIFNNKEKLIQINQIVHPRVALHFKNWVEGHSNKDYIIKEAAILIESGAYKQVDKIIVVSAPIDVRIRRVTERDGMTKAEVQKRLENQLSESELQSYADYLVVNDGQSPILPQILKIHKKMSDKNP